MPNLNDTILQDCTRIHNTWNHPIAHGMAEVLAGIVRAQQDYVLPWEMERAIRVAHAKMLRACDFPPQLPSVAVACINATQLQHEEG